MTIKKHFTSLFILLSIVSLVAQENDLSNSPYSVYGLGVNNNLSTGITNTLGKTGIALPSNFAINNLNPASFGAIPTKRFLYDIGLSFQQQSLIENGLREHKTTGNFSSLSFAFPINSKSGLGITLLPFTNVGYYVTGVTNEIEGSNEVFIADIKGDGGLNDIKLSYGYSINERLRLGLSASYLFGKIEENEINYFENSIFNVTEDNYYKGFQFKTGIQYDVNEYVSLGALASLPTILKGDQIKTVVYGNIDTTNTIDEFEKNLNSFKLPLELGLGIVTNLKESLFLTIDYKRSFWNATNQEDQSGIFVDQNFFGIGAQYHPNNKSNKYWERIMYRMGVNYDSGSLMIGHTKISNSEVTFGVGLPFNRRNNSMINIGYSFGKKGEIANGLIQENYHSFSINLSLENIWFEKKYLD